VGPSWKRSGHRTSRALWPGGAYVDAVVKDVDTRGNGIKGDFTPVTHRADRECADSLHVPALPRSCGAAARWQLPVALLSPVGPADRGAGAYGVANVRASYTTGAARPSSASRWKTWPTSTTARWARQHLDQWPGTASTGHAALVQGTRELQILGAPVVRCVAEREGV